MQTKTRANTLLTVAQAAERLGLTRARVGQLIASGILPASKFGAAWQIDPADLHLAADRPDRRGVWKRKTKPSPKTVP